MFDYLTEMALREYFTIDVTVGNYVTDKRGLFSRLCHVFLLPEEKTMPLFDLIEGEDVRGIATETDYHQYRRMKQYFKIGGTERAHDEIVDELVNLKGETISDAKEFEILQDAEASRMVVCGNLMYAADSGVISAMHALGILQTEGIVFDKNPERGLTYISRAAAWNCEEGLLAALCYDAEHRAKYLACLQERFRRSARLDSFTKVTAVYGENTAKVPREFTILEKAFNLGILKRDKYERFYARLLYSEALGERDKESLIFTPNKELFADACDLPLKLTLAKGTECDESAFDNLLPAHKENIEKIIRSLKNADLRGVSSYRPLCIVSESMYVLESYAAAIADALKDAHKEFIEVSDIGDYDLEPSKANVFVRSCDEDSFNAYFLFFRGAFSERVCDAVQDFTQSAKRGKFRLNHPSVTLNLNAILPICFCDVENARDLAAYCDVVKIKRATKDEKKLIADKMLETKGKAYGIEITMQDSVRSKIANYPVDDAERILDTAIRDHRAAKLELTDEIMKPYFRGADANKGTYGFGGGIYEEDCE